MRETDQKMRGHLETILTEPSPLASFSSIIKAPHPSYGRSRVVRSRNTPAVSHRCAINLGRSSFKNGIFSFPAGGGGEGARKSPTVRRLKEQTEKKQGAGRYNSSAVLIFDDTPSLWIEHLFSSRLWVRALMSVNISVPEPERANAATFDGKILRRFRNFLKSFSFTFGGDSLVALTVWFDLPCF